METITTKFDNFGKLSISENRRYLMEGVDFKDGMIDKYTCTNFEDEEENKKYISDNVLC